MPRVKLSQEVTNGILNMIEKGKISVGEQIPTESKLASIFDVSRTAVREGVKSLVSIGVLETQPGIGTFVRYSKPGPLRQIDKLGPPSTEMILDLLEFRLVVEPETASLAAKRRSAADLKELKRCVDELEKGVAQGVKPPEDLGFHLALARATRNSALVDTSSLISRFYERDDQLPTQVDIDDHRMIYQAVRDGNEEAARTLMRSHLLKIIEHQTRRKSSNTDSPPKTNKNQLKS